MKTVYGAKYESTRDMNRAELAKLIRADIKAAVVAGKLPKAKYSVTKKDFAGGGSINVSFSNVVEAGFCLFNLERLALDVSDPHTFTSMPRYSERATEITNVLEGIMGAYNFDGSDSQSDYFHVRFYGHAKVDWRWEAAERAAMIAGLAAAQKAAPKATPVSAQVEWMSALGAI